MGAFVSTVTLKHSKPHYKPDSHAVRLSHSERAITQPDAETQPETEWNEQAQTVQLLPDTHTLMQLVEKLFVVVVCIFWLWSSEVDFGAPFSKCSVLESFNADDSNFGDKLCPIWSTVTICFLLSHTLLSHRKETNTVYKGFAQYDITPFKSGTKTSYDTFLKCTRLA